MPIHDDHPYPVPRTPNDANQVRTTDVGRAQARADLQMEWHRSEPDREQSFRFSLNLQMWILAGAAAFAALQWLGG